MTSKRICVFLLLFTIFIGCNVVSKHPSSTSLKRKWMLVAMGDFPRDTLIKYATFIDLTKSDNSGNAYMGCNSIGFNYHIQSNTKIKFSNVVATRKYCIKTSKIENEFSRKIISVSTFSTKNAHKLELLDENGKQLFQFVAADWD
jgi:heat shock protein HslJ